jgi:hypothetical protein
MSETVVVPLIDDQGEKEKGEMSGSSDEMVIYEVYRHLAKHRGRTIADRFVYQVLDCWAVRLDKTIGLAAATVSLDHRLTGMDAIISASARRSSSPQTLTSAASTASSSPEMSWPRVSQD